MTSSTVVTEIFLLVLAILAMFISLMVYSEDKKFVNLIDRGLEVVSEVFTEYDIYTNLTKTLFQIKKQGAYLNLIQLSNTINISQF